jgi:hypothetical protein
MRFYLAVLMAGCCGNTQPIAQPKPTPACELPAPPAEPLVKLGRRIDGCPEPWIGCLDREGLDILATYLEAMQGWQREVVVRCGAKGAHP